MPQYYRSALAGCAFLFTMLPAAAGDAPPPAPATSPSQAAPATGAPAPRSQAPTTAPAAPAVPVLDRAQASYGFGLTYGEQLRRAGLNADIDVDSMARGLRDGLDGKKAEPADQQALKKFVASVRESSAMRNRQMARDFLLQNAQQKGVVSRPSGLQYRVITSGNPKLPSPQPVDQVAVQYRGKLMDGTEFDSSYARGQPAIFQASRVINGWQEALGLMKPGDKWQLFIPPELAYDLNSPPSIPPGSLLIFDLELLRIDSPAPGK